MPFLQLIVDDSDPEVVTLLKTRFRWNSADDWRESTRKDWGKSDGGVLVEFFARYLLSKKPSEFRLQINGEDAALANRVNNLRKGSSRIKWLESIFGQSEFGRLVSYADNCVFINPAHFPRETEPSGEPSLSICRESQEPGEFPPLSTAELDELLTRLRRAPVSPATQASERLRWHLADPSTLHYSLATCWTDTVYTTPTISDKLTLEYLREVLGIGQATALMHCVIPSISKVYQTVNVKPLVGQSHSKPDFLKHDVVFLGSTKTNKHSTQFLKKFNEKLRQGKHQPISGPFLKSIEMPRHKIPRRAKADVETVRIKVNDDRNGSFKREAKTIRKHIDEDYGLVIRTPSVFSEATSSMNFLFAGIHTYGTDAAARWFVESNTDEIGERDVVIVSIVKCNFVDGTAQWPEPEMTYLFKWS